MTALAEYFAAQGSEVRGSDVPETFFTDAVLAEHHISVDESFDAGLLPDDCDILVHSTAYTDANPQIAKAKAKGIPVLSYPEALGSIVDARMGISVAGSHGKTTTTAMLGVILLAGKLDPTVIVGSNVPAFHGNAHIGTSDIVVVETDEYQNKFQYYRPKHLLLTNVEYDHPDFFASAEEYAGVFADFLAKLPSEGILVANADDIATRQILQSVNRNAVLVGESPSADYRVMQVLQKGEGQEFTLLTPRKKSVVLQIRLPGMHNVMNAAIAAAFAIEFGVSVEHIQHALAEFNGTTRRFEHKGTWKGADIIDDYAHHPTEVRAAIAAARMRYANRRIIAVFQPHTYSRTKALLADFAEALTADVNILLEVYASAREHEQSVSSADVAALIPAEREHHVIETLEQAAEVLRTIAEPQDVILLMGAGDVWKIAGMLQQRQTSLGN